MLHSVCEWWRSEGFTPVNLRNRRIPAAFRGSWAPQAQTARLEQPRKCARHYFQVGQEETGAAAA